MSNVFVENLQSQGRIVFSQVFDPCDQMVSALCAPEIVNAILDLQRLYWL